MAAEHIRALREATVAEPARAGGTDGGGAAVILQHQLAANRA
jgi:hypothetical protein